MKPTDLMDAMVRGSDVLTAWRSLIRFGALHVATLVFALSVHAQSDQEAVDVDGPYVMTYGDGSLSAWYAEGRHEDGFKKRAQRVKTGTQVRVGAVGRRPPFYVVIRRPASTLDVEEESLRHGAQVFVMGDSHGEYEIATELLINNGVIDANLRWTFGNGRLVVLGDVFDRGKHQTELLWLIYKVEGEAVQAGGKVHLVLGNHETMAMTGDLRYLDHRYPAVASALWVANYSELWSPETLLGQWLRTKPTALRLGKILYMHGGASPELVQQRWTVRRINSTVRAWLSERLDKQHQDVQFISGPLGPLWYRGYFRDSGQDNHEPLTDKNLQAVLDYYQVDRIAVGHTIVPTVSVLHEGRVVAVDVRMATDDGDQMVAEGVIIDARGRWLRAKIDGTHEPLDRQ